MLKPTKIVILFVCLTVLFVIASGFGLHKNQISTLNDVSSSSINSIDDLLPQDIENSFLALAYEKAISNDEIATAKYLNSYIEQTFDFNVLNEHAFDKFNSTQVFQDLNEKLFL